MKTYQIRVAFESDGDGWFAYCPALEEHQGGALTWGQTREAAHEDILKALEIVLGSMVESGLPIPEEPEEAALLEENQIFVTVQPKLKPPKKAHLKQTYRVRVVVEPDEDQWVAFCPALVRRGAATGGSTREEACKNIREVLEMVIETMVEFGEPIPQLEDEIGSSPGEPMTVIV